MKTATLAFNPIEENTYVVWDESGEAVVIDAGNSSDRENAALDNFIAEHGLRPVLAVNTHGHFDHTLGVCHLKERYGIPFALSSKDAFLLENARTSGSIFGVRIGPMPAIDIGPYAGPRGALRTAERRGLHGRHALPRKHRPHRPARRRLFVDHALDIRQAPAPGRRHPRLPRPRPGPRRLPLHGPETTIGHETLYNPFVVEVLNNEVNYKG